MQKKIFSLLVLLMTAVSGAWAEGDVPEVKPFTVPSTWQNSEDAYTADDLPSDFVACSDDEAAAWAASCTEGSALLIYSIDNVYIKSQKGSTKYSSVNQSALFSAQNSGFNIYYTVASAATTVTVNEVAKNQWQFTMPDYAAVAKIEYDTELALNEEVDNTAKLEEWDGYEADVTLTRTLVAGSWNTLAVPFNVSSAALTALNGLLAAQGGSLTVKKFANTTLSGETISLNFEDAHEIVAGNPYLVKVTKDVNLASLSAAIDAAIALGQFSANPFKDAVISKDPVPVETQYADFIPTLGKTLVTGPEGDEDNKDAVLFVAANYTLKHPTVVNDPSAANDASYIKGFRAYFKLNGEAAQARSFSMDLGDGEITGIKAIDNGQLTIDNDRYYDLQGRKVNAAQKGVYIVNGKKVIK